MARVFDGNGLIFEHIFQTRIRLDEFYILSIHFTDNQIVFGCNDEQRGYAVTTPISFEQPCYNRVQAGVNASKQGWSYIRAAFDCICRFE